MKIWFKQNKWLIFLFLAALTFFILQRATMVSWDWSVYVLNAKYWFSHGTFFEWTTFPLCPFLLGILSFLSWKVAEYAYIIIIALLHLFSSIKLAEKFKINRTIFYAVSLSPFLLIFGLANGTELLSLALLQLFFAFFRTKKAPIFLALSFLARYQNLVFFPLLFFTKSWKKICRDILIFILTVSPWLLFNHFATGNAFTSIMDSYALNIKFRYYIHQPFSLIHLLQMTNFLLPLGILGIIKSKKRRIEFWVMLFFVCLVLISYARIPIKNQRYLFNLLLPFSYFSAVGIEKIRKRIAIITLLLLLSFSFAVYKHLATISDPALHEDIYLKVLNETKQNINNCALASNGYVQLNYIGRTCERAPDVKLVNYKIEQGYRLLLFDFIPEPSYVLNKTFLMQFPILQKGNHYLLIGNSSLCAPIRNVNTTYIQRVNELYKIAYNSSFTVTFYELFFTDKKP